MPRATRAGPSDGSTSLRRASAPFRRHVPKTPPETRTETHEGCRTPSAPAEETLRRSYGKTRPPYRQAEQNPVGATLCGEPSAAHDFVRSQCRRTDERRDAAPYRCKDAVDERLVFGKSDRRTFAGRP